MKVDALKAEDLPQVWNWLIEEPELHFDDFGPKTFEEFLDYVKDSEDLVFFAFHNGKKLVGSAGFSTSEKAFRGIVFSPDVRGTGIPVTAMRALLLLLWRLGVKEITARYFITNKRVPGFFRKLGANFLGLDGHTTQGGVPVQYVKVSFHAPTDAHLQLATS